jgi:3-hydroxyisobutyrate dehydrogenase-like beta-hydroxyacid dehydrogenase
MKVGFVSAGRMGRPMVARLVQGGHDVRALGRNAQKRADLERLGARVADDVAAVAAQADVVVVCVDLASAGGSVSSFTETTHDFVGKDVVVGRGIAAELGSDIGVLDGVIKAVDVADPV